MADDYSKILDENKYEYLATLGAGTFATVIKARHVPLGVPVAIKVLHASMLNSVQAPKRMRIEAQAMAQLGTHPNIVEAIDYGQTSDGRPYIAMRFVEGRSLEAELRERKTLPAYEAVQLTLQMLAGLEAAHALGIVHRDLKPGNMMLAPGPNGPTLKLLDFGIARVAQGSGKIKPLTQGTADGTMIGTPRYCAPEQARGDMQDIDARTDVYAVGGILFHMLTGSAPFASPGAFPTTLDLFRAQVSSPAPSLSDRSAEPFPAALDIAIKKALSKNRAERHENAAAFAAALRSIPGAELVAPPASARLGTEPIHHQQLMQEVSKRQRAVQEKAAVEEKRTVRIDRQARVQELSRLKLESGWRGSSPEAAPASSTMPMAPRSVSTQQDERDDAATLAIAPRRQGFTRRETVIIAAICGLVIAASVIALLRHFAP